MTVHILSLCEPPHWLQLTAIQRGASHPATDLHRKVAAQCTLQAWFTIIMTLIRSIRSVMSDRSETLNYNRGQIERDGKQAPASDCESGFSFARFYSNLLVLTVLTSLPQGTSPSHPVTHLWPVHENAISLQDTEIWTWEDKVCKGEGIPTPTQTIIKLKFVCCILQSTEKLYSTQTSILIGRSRLPCQHILV